MKIVTAGSAFVDIDAYGGCIAYAELLQKQGTEAVAVSTAPLNESITSTVRSWDAGLETMYTPSSQDTFTLIDVSNPKFFDTFVETDSVEEVIDHHTGFEQFWQDKIGDKARIEFIGAACTLVFERWQAAGKTSEMSQASARLLATGILDNTLNFKANVTTDRDHEAYNTLLAQSGLSSTWPAQYFSECQAAIEANLGTAINNDFKYLDKDPKLPSIIGQIVIWDAAELLKREIEIRTILKKISPDWWLNIVSIDTGVSYFMTSDKNEETKFTHLIDADFVEGVAKADRLYLRKEILKAAQN